MPRPYISNSSYYKLTVPELSGGVNLRDNISLIHDNQLTDCENVWYKDGMLRTRPSLKVTDYNKTDDMYIINRFAAQLDEIIVYANEKNVRIEDGHLYFLVVTRSEQDVHVKYLTVSNPEKPVIDVVTIPILNSERINVFQKGGDIYLFGSYDKWAPDDLPIFKIWEENGVWKYARAEEKDEETGEIPLKCYVPTVMINCPPTSTQDSADKLISRGATMLEGFNLLGNRYKMLFNNALEYQSELSGNVESDALKFALLEDTLARENGKSLFEGQTVVAWVTNEQGAVTKHEVTINGSGASVETSVRSDGYKMHVFGKLVAFLDANGKQVWTARNKFLRNCIEIEAPCKNTEKNLKKVLNMTFNEWYGGGEGLYGGMHLFMGGNTEEKEKSLVIWSDINKPLYFSENCYAYVGDKAQKVTAFGKQGESLVIAKEHEMYATEYTNNSQAVTEEAVQNQALVDITTDVIFPMYQVHGFIGCDCPKTMQLCRNRLVWAHSSGKVYSLVSATAYNERSVYEVSGMVERRLKGFAREKLQEALSADWQGHYVLMVDSKMFLMDYNTYGFSNVYSYSKNEDAESKIPWWIWDIEFPEKMASKSLTSIEDKLYFSTVVFVGNGEKPEAVIEIMYFDGEGTIDNFPSIKGESKDEYEREIISREIPTMLQTKFYDFGTPTMLKNIPKIELVFGTNGGAPITSTVITDKGESDTEIYIEAPEVDRYSVGHFENKLIRPSIQRANRIALKFECKGDMAIDSMTILYKQLGGLK